MTNFVVMDSVGYSVSLAAVLVLLGTSSSSIHSLANWRVTKQGLDNVILLS